MKRCDASGRKLRKVTTEPGVTIGDTSNITVTTTTHYLGAAFYESKTYSTLPGGVANCSWPATRKVASARCVALRRALPPPWYSSGSCRPPIGYRPI